MLSNALGLEGHSGHVPEHVCAQARMRMHALSFINHLEFDVAVMSQITLSLRCGQLACLPRVCLLTTGLCIYKALPFLV